MRSGATAVVDGAAEVGLTVVAGVVAGSEPEVVVVSAAR